MNTLTWLLTRLVISPVVWLLHRTGACGLLLVRPGFEAIRWHLGRLGAWVRIEQSRRTVPAYREFLAAHGLRAIRGLADVPATDKATYVKPYPIAARCVGGVLPAEGIVIDESSGSGGLPTCWVRGVEERRVNGRTIRLGLRRRLGQGPIMAINAFALGPWATGINLTLSLSSWCRVKSTGPDVARIANTLREFGADHHFVIMGYPPFLKLLVDHAGIDWRRHRVSMIYGGEGMSESMRRYLQGRGISGVFGSYGASDLELNVAAETDLTIALRRLLSKRPDLASRVLARTGAMPMIFQFNPADFFIESNDAGELLVTVCRPGYVSPKLRYNIHDLGHVMRFPELERLLTDGGVDVRSLEEGALDLPLLFLYGRSDASVAYYGCKVPPADVQEAIFGLPVLARHVDSFQLNTFDDAEGDKRFSIRLEVSPELLAVDTRRWESRLLDALGTVNQDFRASREMAPAEKQADVEFHLRGTGPFAGADRRIKLDYIRSEAPVEEMALA